MLKNKTITLFIIGFLCLLITLNVRSVSISQIGDVRIAVSDDIWICDQIECPHHAHRCFVSKHQDPNDPSILIRTNICYSKDNQILQEYRITQLVDPNARIRMRVNSYRNGVISSDSSNGNGGNFNENYSDSNTMHQDLGNEQRNFNENLNRDMSNLNRNLQHMTQNINRDVNNQMRNLNYNLKHMFD